MSARDRLFACALGTALVAAAASADARDLHWKSLAVTARIDAQGVLHVRERHHVVMTGDWNGGERVFRLADGQAIALDRVTRVDPATGATRVVEEGDVEQVDRFEWADVSTLRWRSRAPSDRVFDRTELVHDLEYRLFGAVVPSGSGYAIAHDFAFADRAGVILSHSVLLTVDEPWAVEGPRTRTIEAGTLRPGSGHVVRLALGWAGGGSPALAPGPSAAPPWLPAIVLVFLAALYLHFLLSEILRGRFVRGDARAAEAPGWLEANLLGYRAEEASAVWNGSIGAPEISATIARLAGEGRLRTRISGDGKDLVVTLVADRETFEGYERTLVDGLFFDDRTETSTTALRYHHNGSFDLSKHVRPALAPRVAAIVGPPVPAWALFVLPSVLFAAAIALVVFADAPANARVGLGLRVVFGGLVAAYPAFLITRLWRRRGHWGWFRCALVLAPSVVLAWLAWSFATKPGWVAALVSGSGSGAPGYVGAARLAAVCMTIGLVSAILNGARTRGGRAGATVRRRLASARLFFERELRSARPRLRDAWFPYVVALGLDKASHRWFRQHGGDASSMHDDDLSSSSSGGGAAAPSSWTGGGGAFGGAGATASWASAADGLSSGGSSSSDSSSDSSSSGGGGGGGW